MPTIEQIRAARALLGWSQHDLADKAGLSQTGIARIENGTNQPNSKTIQKIESAFDNANVEFLGSDGIRKKPDEILILKGAGGLRKMVDDLYDCTKSAFDSGENIEGYVYLYNASPKNWHKWLGKEWWDMHSQRMSAMGNKIQKLLISEQDAFTISAAFSEHRAFPENLFNDQAIYAYAGKLVFVTFDNDVEVKILENAQFCEGFRVLFDIAWDHVARKI